MCVCACVCGRERIGGVGWEVGRWVGGGGGGGCVCGCGSGSGCV